MLSEKLKNLPLKEKQRVLSLWMEIQKLCGDMKEVEDFNEFFTLIKEEEAEK